MLLEETSAETIFHAAPQLTRKFEESTALREVPNSHFHRNLHLNQLERHGGMLQSTCEASERPS